MLLMSTALPQLVSQFKLIWPKSYIEWVLTILCLYLTQISPHTDKVLRSKFQPIRYLYGKENLPVRHHLPRTVHHRDHTWPVKEPERVLKRAA